MKHTESSALAMLAHNNVVVAGKQIEGLNHGIKIQGAIDFLCKNCGYSRAYQR